MNADHLALRYVSGGLLDRLFGSPEDAIEAAMVTFGKDMLASVTALAPEVQRASRQTAKSHGVAEDYLNYVIFRNRQSWPIKGKLSDALTLAKDIVLEAGRPPSMKNLSVDQDDAQVDKAVQSMAKWVSTDFKKKIHSMLWKHASKHAKPLIMKLNQSASPGEMTKYLLVKTFERLKQHTLLFDNSYLLNAVFKLVG